jgi:hypothetical protein
MKPGTRSWVWGAALVILAVVAVWMAWRRPATPSPLIRVTNDGGDDDGGPVWLDIVGIPYDEAVGKLRTKYSQTFPIMVLREGDVESMPETRDTLYLWVNKEGRVQQYTYHEQEGDVVRHGGIVRTYDKTTA